MRLSDRKYVADKGKQFVLTEKGKKECASYRHKTVGEPVDECSDCRWYKVNNKEEVEQLQKYYNAEDYLNITDFPSIVFIECTEDEDVYYTTLEDCKSYVRQLFSALDVDFIK